MSFDTIINRTELARRTRQAVEQARRGQTILVESYGEEQVAIIDALDYRLLRALAHYRSRPISPIEDVHIAPRGLSEETLKTTISQAAGDIQAAWDIVISTYLDGDISLGRAAELLNLSRFELMARFNRLGLPLQLGTTTIAEAQAEVDALSETTG
jgi:predicted HTH domain antitoxin